jgi:hypothetical protein
MPVKRLLLLAVLTLPLACADPSEGTPDGMGGGAAGGGGSPSGTGGTTGGNAGSGGAAAGAAGSGGTTSAGTAGSTGTAGAAGGGGSGGSSSGAAGTSAAAGRGGAGGRGGTTGGAGGAGAAGAGGRGGTTGGAGAAGSASAGAGGRGGGGTSGASGRGGTTGTAGAGGGSAALCPPGITQTITVAKDGSGQFTTVQAAVNSIASGSSTHIRIDIKAGTYTEKLTIASRTNLCLVGAGATTTILSYNDSNASVGSTSGSASVLISANDFSAANLTIQNSYGTGSQAVALRTTGQRQQFLNCRFVGYQDTLYTHSGTQYFRDCYVQGNTDYVFGGATAVLENC